MQNIRQLKSFILNNYRKFIKLLASVLLGCLIKFALTWYFEPDLNDLIQFLLVYIPTGVVTGVMFMGEITSGTGNIANYSANSDGRDGISNITNYSTNNQGRDGTSNITNNSANNQGRVGTGNQNDTANTSTDSSERVISAFERAFSQSQNQLTAINHLQTRIQNNQSHLAAFIEQLNQPNLPLEDMRRLQQHYLRLSRENAMFTEQIKNKHRELSEITRQLSSLLPQYNQIIEDDSDIE